MPTDIHGVRVIETPQLEAPAIPLPTLATAGLLVSLSPNVPLTDVDAEAAGADITVDSENPIDNLFTKPEDPMLPEGDKEIGFDEPFLVTRRSDVPSWMTGDEGTVAASLNAVFAQGNARVIVVPVEDIPNGDAITGTAVQGNFAATIGTADFNVTRKDALTTAATPSDVAAFVFAASFTGIDQIAKLVNGQVIQIVTTETTPKDFGNFTVVSNTVTTAGVRTLEVTGGSTTITETFTPLTGTPIPTYTFTATAQDGVEETRINAVGVQADKTGIYAMLNAKSIHGYAPRVICAPGIDTGAKVASAKNPLGAAMETVAGRLRSISIIDSGANTRVEALDRADDYGSDRVLFLDPAVKASRNGKVEIQDASGFIAGVIMETDARQGFWTPPSNKLVNGVLGTSRPIDFEMGDPNSDAQLLNNAQIGTIVNIDGGYRFWGDYTQATGDRVTWRFLNVRRIADALYDAIAQNHLWAVDRVITKIYLEAVSTGVNKLIRDLVSREALSGGICYPDPELNSEANISQGKVAFNLDFTPVYPARTVEFYIRLTTRYLQGLAA